MAVDVDLSYFFLQLCVLSLHLSPSSRWKTLFAGVQILMVAHAFALVLRVVSLASDLDLSLHQPRLGHQHSS